MTKLIDDSYLKIFYLEKPGIIIICTWVYEKNWNWKVEIKTLENK